jgi:hypothetical protein
MARGTQFGVLVSRVRNRVGRSNTAGSSGVADYNQIKEIINAHYEHLYRDYDWPHLRIVTERIALSAGDRYYDVPTSELDYESIERAVVWTNGQPIAIERGIDFEDYSAFSSEDDDRSGPVLKWDIRFTGSTEQIEVWPMPDGNDQELQFRGFRKFARLVADADLCRLDDNLVVGFAVAELAANQGLKDAQLKLTAAQGLYNRLRGRVKGGSKTHSFADVDSMRPKPVTVVVG